MDLRYATNKILDFVHKTSPFFGLYIAPGSISPPLWPVPSASVAVCFWDSFQRPAGQFLVVAVSRTGQPPFNVPEPGWWYMLKTWWFINQPIKKKWLDFRGALRLYLFFCHGETWKNCPEMEQSPRQKRSCSTSLFGERESGKEDAFQTPKQKKIRNNFAKDMFTFKHGEDR